MMSAADYSIMDVKLISPSPMNPRKDFSGQSFDEIIASIKQKGVIQPIVIRPVEGKATPFEIVVGERRYRASIAAALELIPAIIRHLTDDEAYDFMLVENLHREDLTEREEAESFRAYTARHGEDGIVTLAEKTGIKPGYIRSRIKVLELPATVLKAWDKGDLAFGHLQQLLRIPAEAREEVFGWLMEGGDSYEGSIPGVKELVKHITGESPALSGAFFKTKEHCSTCVSNSLVQRSMFDVEAKKAHCLNPACFKQLQSAHLAEHWKDTAIAKEHGTNGFRFSEDTEWQDIECFNSWGLKPGAKCRKCPDFVSIIEITGKVSRDKVCIGDKACYRAVTSPRSAKGKETGERDPEAPRASWHGEYFRDVFLSRRISEVLPTIDPYGQKARALLLVCAMHPGYRNYLNTRENFSGGILKKNPEEVDATILKTLEKIILDGQHVGESSFNGFGTKGRQLVARYLGIDLAAEFAVDKGYLEKKTKAEIVAFGKKFKFLDPAQVGKLKKGELIKQVLAHGDKLVGKVPKEILK